MDGEKIIQLHDKYMKWVVEPGEFEIMTGPSFHNEGLPKVILTLSKQLLL